MPMLLILLLALGPPQHPVPAPVAAPAPAPVPARQGGVVASGAAIADGVRRAEDLLEHGDFKAAEPVLAQLAASSPRDAHILFDLGFTQEHNGKDAAAAGSYAAAVAADPTFPEPRLALGLLQARSGQAAAARTTLDGASRLSSITPALKARALRALARLDQSAHADQARDELMQAIQLTGEGPGDAELTASLTGNAADAQATYRRALAENPGDPLAIVELASLLQREHKLAEADALLTPALAAHPDDPGLLAQTATLYAAEDKIPEALALLKGLRDVNPQAKVSPSLTRLYAHLLLVSGDAAQAELLYRSLAETTTNDPSLLDDLGSTLVREQKFAEAEGVLSKAVAQRDAFHDDAAWGEAAGHLAFAASRNHNPQVALQALHARATVLPNSPATLFLEATAHDSLRQKKEAERAYRAFLAVANGKLPDEEFEARHRLIALEHEH